MKKRYQLKRGRRCFLQYDVLIYRDDKLRFGGSFVTDSWKRLSSDDVKIIAAIKSGLETLNP